MNVRKPFNCADTNASIDTVPFNRQYAAAFPASLICITNLSLVLLIIFKRKLRTTTNIIICSSCISSILFSFMILLNAMVITAASEQFGRYFSNLVVNPLFELTVGAIFNFHVTIISFERFYSVVLPFHYRRHDTFRNTTLALMAVWILPVVIIYIPLHIVQLRYSYKSCLNNFYSDNTKLLHIILSTVFFLPLLAISITYIIIMIQVWRMKRNETLASRTAGMIALATAPVMVMADSNTNLRHHCNSHPKQYERQQEMKRQRVFRHKKVLLQMLLLIGIYSISLFPFYIVMVLYLQNFDNDLVPAAYITYLIAISYLFFHPILSVAFTFSIKDECKKLWLRLQRRWSANKIAPLQVQPSKYNYSISLVQKISSR